MNLRSKTIGLATVVALGLTACGSNVGGSEGTARPDSLEVGALFAMTGQYASYGEQQSSGVKLAFKQINAEGGAEGTELKLKIEDIKGEATAAVSAMNKLATVDKVPFVFTSISNIISATAPIGDQHEVVMMNGGGTAPTLAGLSEYLFHNVPLENNHIENVATYASEELGAQTMGILLTDDALGQADADVMEETWKEMGGTVVGRETAETSTTTFRAQLSQLAAEKPDAIYMALGGQHIAIALNQKEQLGIDAQILGTSFWTVPETVEAAKGSSEGVIFSTQQWNPNDPQNELAKKFVDDYTKEYGQAPQGNSAAYYVGARILGDVVSHLNEENTPISGPNLREALVEIGTFETIFGELTFAEDGTSTMPLTMLTVKDGQFVPVN